MNPIPYPYLHLSSYLPIHAVAAKRIDQYKLDTFLEESQMLRFLSHPNVVKFNGFYLDESTSQYWMVMEYMKHEGMNKFLKAYKAKTTREWDMLLISL